MQGQNCGNCKRGSESTENPKCKKCWKTEFETKVRFSEWEAK